MDLMTIENCLTVASEELTKWCALNGHRWYPHGDLPSVPCVNVVEHCVECGLFVTVTYQSPTVSDEFARSLAAKRRLENLRMEVCAAGGHKRADGTDAIGTAYGAKKDNGLSSMRLCTRCYTKDL